MQKAKSTTRTFWYYARQPHTVWRSTKVALVVGTIFAFINYSDDVITGEFTRGDFMSAVISYLVPFCVATYGAAREAGYHQVDPNHVPRSTIKS